jgi:hypothetical protein
MSASGLLSDISASPAHVASEPLLVFGVSWRRLVAFKDARL